MKRVEDECVGCTSLGLPCMGLGCPNRNVTRLYCDKCDEEVDVLYEYEGQELCEECLLEIVPKITE